MAEENTAREHLWPEEDSDIILRAVFLYVGQGSSTLLLVSNGDDYDVLLIDINLDKKNGGIDVPALVADLVGEQGLYAFVNTHPHVDHLSGAEELSKLVSVGSVWHSGHIPGKKHDKAYKALKALIKKVSDANGEVVTLKGSKKSRTIGAVDYYVLAPAKYVMDEIQDEKPEERYQRIHEQCAVLRIGIGDKWILIPGDADRPSFENHITDYHKERMPSVVLAASHHGSKSFFLSDEEEEPYLDGLKAISPIYVIVSAPKKDESPHDHPDDQAMKTYREQCGKDNVLHTGAKRYSFICDIYRDGSFGGISNDKGELGKAYSLDNSDDGDDGKGKSAKVVPIPGHTRVDDRPMGDQ